MSPRSVDKFTAIALSLLALAASLASGGATKMVSTVAGRPGVWSIIDGTLAEAAFSREYNPVVELDPFGNLYYSELTAIRMVTSTGVTTIAGNATAGTDDGIGTAARFTELYALCFDVTGQIMYMCDNHAIRQMVMSTRRVTTIAGIKGSSGTADGTPGQFYLPYTPTVLGNGSLVVTDNHNHAIRIVVGSEVWTIAGQKGTCGSSDGDYATAQFCFPEGIVTAADGATVFVSDAWGRAIRRIVGRTVTSIAGKLGVAGYADGVGSQARFYGPSSLKRVGSVLYVTELGNALVRRLNITSMSNVVVTTVAGLVLATTSIDGNVTIATMYDPIGIAVAPNFTIYFTQHFTRLIRQIACPAGYVGEDCDSCATNYENYPNCSAILCTIAGNCSGHATAVNGTLISGCTCTCATGYTGATCNGCAANYENYPSCSAILCTIAGNCSGHATAVNGTLVSGCTCTCATGYTGATCNGCAANYENYPSCSAILCTIAGNCSGHATAVNGTLISGCTCTCATGYTGATCNGCAANYENYPSCSAILCTIAANCSGHATAVNGTLISGCTCTCATGYTGATCNGCAANYENYPSCSAILCTIAANCSGHAAAVNGTLISGCTCTCAAGYTGTTCNGCAANYENYPSCSAILCTIAGNCSGHATAVNGTLISGCTCTCATGYTGATCNGCAANYENYPSCSAILCTIAANCSGHAAAVNGTLISGCTCTCAAGYTGTTCNGCAANYENYPSCSAILCTIAGNCSGHATAVNGTLISGCTCTCATGYTGTTCNGCAANYENYPSCSAILCTIAGNCSGHATAVNGTLVSGCTCTCATGYTGTTCNGCAANYENYPSCSAILCTIAGNCSGHATAVNGTLVSGCTCTCATGYTGTTCNGCAANYENYPSCSAILCTIAGNCSGHATAVNGTLISGCTCTCATGYTGPKCDSCATHYENYPTCLPIPCYVGSDCSGHATNVSGNVVAGCVCECSRMYAGPKCDQCAHNYKKYPNCTTTTRTHSSYSISIIASSTHNKRQSASSSQRITATLSVPTTKAAPPTTATTAPTTTLALTTVAPTNVTAVWTTASTQPISSSASDTPTSAVATMTTTTAAVSTPTTTASAPLTSLPTTAMVPTTTAAASSPPSSNPHATITSSFSFPLPPNSTASWTTPTPTPTSSAVLSTQQVCVWLRCSVAMVDVLASVASATHVAASRDVYVVSTGACVQNASSGAEWKTAVLEVRLAPPVSVASLESQPAIARASMSLDSCVVEPESALSPLVIALIVVGSGLGVCLLLLLALMLLMRRRRHSTALRRRRERANLATLMAPPRNNMQFGLASAEEELLGLRAEPDPVSMDDTLLLPVPQAGYVAPLNPLQGVSDEDDLAL